MTGTLHVVATPIGNLADCSDRLRTTLASCALILCEDTRRTGRLLEALAIEGTLRTCNEQDERRRIPEVLELLDSGADVALVSDAGTPCISDPGYRLVRAAAAAGHVVSPVPGASSVVAALSVSGLATDSFAFEGFLPRKSVARRGLLAALADEPRTLVFLETPHRIGAALQDLRDAFGDEREAVLCRELTKLHEEVARGSLAELAERFGSDDVRGEIVLVVAGAPPREIATDAESLRARVRELEAEGRPPKEALREAAKESGLPRREVYRLVKLERDDDD